MRQFAVVGVEVHECWQAHVQPHWMVGHFPAADVSALWPVRRIVYAVCETDGKGLDVGYETSVQFI